MAQTPPSEYRKIVFFGIYAVCAFVLAALLIFNTGFEIKEEYNQGALAKHIYLVNVSGRPIENITVKYTDNRTLNILRTETIPGLGKDTNVELSLEGIASPEVRISAESALYGRAEKVVIVGESSPSISVDYEKPVFFGKRFAMTLEYCNNGTAPLEAKVIEQHDALFFYEKGRTDTLNLSGRECGKVNYSFLPAYRGETRIYFNVLTSNNNEHLEETVRVE